MKNLIKKIGNQKKDCFTVEATTWDGKHRVVVVTPKKPTPQEKQDTINFLFELDDHDGYNEYLKRLT